MSRRFGLTIALTWVLPLVVSLMAQRGHAETLHDLYLLALSNDPTYQSATFVLQAAKQQQPEAFAALMPQLVTTASGSRVWGRTKYSETPEVNRTFGTDQWTLQLTQPVFRIDNLLAYGEARVAVEQAVWQFATAEQDLILRLAKAYFDALIAQGHVSATHAQVVALREQLLAARHSYDAGVASITDVDDTQSHAAQAEAQNVAALNDLESAHATLEAIIGQPVPPLDELKEDAVLPKPDPEDAGQWISRATAESPAVKASRSALSMTEFDVRRSEALHFPTLDLVGTYGGNYSSGNITDPNNFGSNVRDRQVSLQVSMPLFEGGLLRARMAEARAKRSKAQADLLGAERQVAVMARQSYSAIMSGVSQVQALQTGLAAARNAVKGNRVGYGLGIRINSDVLNAEQQLSSTDQDLTKARYDTLFESLKLKAAAGNLSPEDLREMGRLFDTHPRDEVPDRDSR